jgi:hypothetical protein
MLNLAVSFHLLPDPPTASKQLYTSMYAASFLSISCGYIYVVEQFLLFQPCGYSTAVPSFGYEFGTGG